MFEKWSVSERRGTAAALATACLAFLAWAYPNMTRIITIPGAIICGILTLYMLWPEIKAIAGSLNATWSPDGKKVQNEWVRGLVGTALLCLLVGGGYIASHRHPAPDIQPPVPQDPIVVRPNETLASKYNHMIFLCDKTKTDNERNQWKEYTSVVSAAQGVSAVFTDLENGGLKIEATPPQPSPFIKVTAEIRRLKDQLFVTRTLETTAAYAWMALPITDTNDPQLQEQILRVERLIGAQSGACHFF